VLRVRVNDRQDHDRLLIRFKFGIRRVRFFLFHLQLFPLTTFFLRTHFFRLVGLYSSDFRLP